ncbi:MAG: alpha/beta hydrolase, partial [Cyanobacteria bacterium J06632_3]
MEIAPFKIKQLTLDDARLRVKTQSISANETVDTETCAEFPAYLVVSTAPHNIDEVMATPTQDSVKEAKQGLGAIARHLHRIQSDPTITEPPELVVAVHGYNTAEKGIKAWYSDIYRYIAQDDQAIRQRRNLVFIGYRWSSERVSLHPLHLWRNVRALPDVPQALLGLGLAFMLIYWGWTLFWEPLWQNNWANLIGASSLSLAVGISVMIATLLVLRTTVYFRDVYRAINFGVPDLTELIRQIDQAVVDLRVADLHHRYPNYSDAMRQAKRIASGQTLETEDGYQKIKLNFLGHSMGGLVITNVVRILSDVFDRRSISQNPIPDIGNTLSLGRLILASPDVPVLSIISSRSNGLASSLRRFREAYLFSNEGDLALRLASTAANYISFPSARQNHGHRLGSVALVKTPKQGLINLESLQRYYPLQRPLGQAMAEDDYDILNSLYITHSGGKGDGYLSLGELFSLEHAKLQRASLADLFTFFDCTDYKDYRLVLTAHGRRDRTPEETGLLTRAKQKARLSFWDYTELAIDCLRGQLDVHGGYFRGEYSRKLIYRLAFLGFEGMLNAITDEESETNASA